MTTMIDKMRGTKLPDYYDTMYQDGYKPYEILQAAHNTMLKHYYEEHTPQQPEPPMNVNLKVEVKRK